MSRIVRTEKPSVLPLLAMGLVWLVLGLVLPLYRLWALAVTAAAGAAVYVVFDPPIRTCLYGDYRTREEAEAVMYKLKATRKFKEISVKKCLINLPY